jgi:hypothetical protein
MSDVTASADDATFCRAFPARRRKALLLLALTGGCVLISGCGRAAVIVDNPPPNTTTLVTVERVPQTQPSDKKLIVRDRT